MVIATTSIILQIVGISLGMVLISQLFQIKFGVTQGSQMNMQLQTQEIQDQLRQAQAQGDSQRMMELQAEMMEIMKGMYKKQLLPMCIRSLFFFGIYALLNWLYSDYEIPGLGRWFYLYLIISLGSSLLISFLRKYLKKRNPSKDDSQAYMKDHAQVLKPNLVNVQARNRIDQMDFASDNGTNKNWKVKINESTIEDAEYVDSESNDSDSKSWKRNL